MRDQKTDLPAKRTLASTMYAQLRDEILTGAVPPEAKLNIRELCTRFGVGLSPAREALSRLSAAGLVRQTDNRGFSVMPVSSVELLDLTKARCWINEIALRESIAGGGPEWEENVLISYHRLSRTPRHLGSDIGDRNPAWEEAHRQFHRALISGCGSNTMVDACERLFEMSERYRHVARAAGTARGKQEQEHRALMQAAIDGKADEAIELMNAHFRRTAELVGTVIARREPAEPRGKNGKPRRRHEGAQPRPD